MITSISRGIIGMYSTMLKTEGDIIVTQAKIADTFFSDVNVSLADKIQNIAGVKEVYALILGASPINDLPIAAIYGVSENRFKTYALTEGAYPKKGEVILGKNINARLHTPKFVSISNKTFSVSGIFENGVGFEDGGAVLNREDASAIFNKEASILLVSMERGYEANALIENINAQSSDIEAKTTHEFVDNYNQFKIDHFTHLRKAGLLQDMLIFFPVFTHFFFNTSLQRLVDLYKFKMIFTGIHGIFKFRLKWGDDSFDKL